MSRATKRKSAKFRQSGEGKRADVCGYLCVRTNTEYTLGVFLRVKIEKFVVLTNSGAIGSATAPFARSLRSSQRFWRIAFLGELGNHSQDETIGLENIETMRAQSRETTNW